MSGNICGVEPLNTFQYMPCAGLGSMLCSDYDNIDFATGASPLMGMCGSVFGTVPMMGGCGGLNSGSYLDNMKQYQRFFNDYYIDQRKMQRNADLQINGSMEAIEEAAVCLKDKVTRNEQDQIMKAYQKYVDCVRHAYGDSSEEDVNSRALALYNRLTGKTLTDDLRHNSHGSMLQGYIHALTCGTYSRRSAEDNIAEITGQEVPIGEKDAQNTGRVLGGLTIGGALFSGLKYFTKMKTGKAAIIGGIAAAVAAGLSFITGKVKT